MHCPVIELAKALIRRESVSPADNGCQALMIARLNALGFTTEQMPSGDTKNFWAWRRGRADGPGKTLAFAGHTDVVPPGDLSHWQTPPFEPVLSGGMLYGRGASDMKGSLAAMVVAAERFVTAYPDHPGRLAFLITSDEEAAATDGTVRVVENLMARGERVDYCLVGEPSSQALLGDMMKNGRRGSVTANLIIHGVQGHVAYPHLADNPVHRAAPFLLALTSAQWDDGNEFFPPTSMQIANIHAGTGSNNVIPGDLSVQFNFRFSTESTVESLQQRVTDLLAAHQLNHTLTWSVSGHPFLTPEGPLTQAVTRAVEQYCHRTPVLSTAGGTSDGRFIARMGTQVVELGPLNATIHKVNECVSAADLQQLSRIYQRIMEQILL